MRPYKVLIAHQILSLPRPSVRRDGVEEIVNLQPLKDGKAKPYQVRQIRQLIQNHKLHTHE